MAEDNQGIAPPDSSTELGQLRYVIGDFHYEELTPPVAGQGVYQWFGDVALTVFLDRSDNDVDKASILAFRSMGDYLAAESASIKTDDLQVGDLWRRAQFFYDRADKAEANLNADIFTLASIGPDYECTPELAPIWWPDGWRPCLCLGECTCR